MSLVPTAGRTVRCVSSESRSSNLEADEPPEGSATRQCAPKSIGAIIVSRPSDRRGSGSDPKPQCAFKMSMFNVSCNSH